MDRGEVVERTVFELSRVVFVHQKTIANCLLQLGNYRYCRYLVGILDVSSSVAV